VYPSAVSALDRGFLFFGNRSWSSHFWTVVFQRSCPAPYSRPLPFLNLAACFRLGPLETSVLLVFLSPRAPLFGRYRLSFLLLPVFRFMLQHDISRPLLRDLYCVSLTHYKLLRREARFVMMATPLVFFSSGGARGFRFDSLILYFYYPHPSPFTRFLIGPCIRDNT